MTGDDLPGLILFVLGLFSVVGLAGWGVVLFQRKKHIDRVRVGAAWLSWRPLPPLLLLVLFSVTAGGLVFQGVLWLGFHPWIGEEPHPVLLLALSMITMHIPIAGAAVLWMWLHKVSAREGLGLEPKGAMAEFLPGTCAYFLGLVLAFIGGMMTGLIFHLFDWTVTPQHLVTQMELVQGPVQIILVLLMGVVLIPFCEEIVFRGVLLPWLTRRIGFVAGLLAHAFLFALVHMHAAGILSLMGFAIMVGLVFSYRKSLMAAFWMHAIHNAVIFGSLFLSRLLEGG